MAHTENQTLFPKWTREDRERSFELAKAKGYETDKTWRGCCAFWFNQWQKHNAKPQAPAAAIARKAFSPAKLPQVKSSWRTPGLEKFRDEWEWDDAGCPKDWATWLKWGCPLRKGLPAPHELTRRLQDLLVEAWNKGQTLTLEDAQKKLGTIKETDWEIGEARAKHQMKQENAPLIHGLLNGLVGDTSAHTKPSRDQFILEAKRLGLSAQDADTIYRELEANKWLMKDGTPIKNWKGCLNGCAKKERRTHKRHKNRPRMP